MDHMEIIQAVISGKILEITSQTKNNAIAVAYLDGDKVSVSQAVRASKSNMIKVSAKISEWTAYKAVSIA